MCAQCAGTAVTAVGAASGMRAYVAARSPVWLTPGRLRALTAALVLAAILAATVRPWG